MAYLVIVGMNGFAASSRGEDKLEPFTSDIVIDNVMGRDLNGYIPVFRDEKGTNLYTGDDESVHAFVEAYSDPENIILAFGKSRGGKDVINILDDATSFSYKRSVLITIDPCWVPISSKRKEFRRPTEVDCCINFYQHSGFIKGATMKGDDVQTLTDDTVIDFSKPWEMKLTGKDVTFTKIEHTDHSDEYYLAQVTRKVEHPTIPYYPKIAQTIQDAIKYLVGL